MRIPKLVLLIVVVASLCAPRTSAAQTIRPDFCSTNGAVRATALAGDRLYIAGEFTSVGPASPMLSAAELDAATGAPVASFPVVTGWVAAFAPDGAGGWYIGGSFTAVGGVARNSLAHILADHSVSDWNPAANGPVIALAVSGSTVYAGGNFTSIGGAVRHSIAALDATTGLATPWDPAADRAVRTLLVRGSTVYAGGDFNSIGGQPRSYIAALDASSGAATSWAPNANAPILSLVADDNNVYAGGGFTGIAGLSRQYLAALDVVTGAATSWDPGVDQWVYALALDGSTLYAGGAFAVAGAQARNRLAAFDVVSGVATSWDPNADGTATALALSGSMVFVSGQFTNVGGQGRCSLAALDATSGLASAWNPGASSSVGVLGVSASSVFVGGRFVLGWRSRSRIAAVNAITGLPTEWNPTANGRVLALAADGGTVYAGGEFTAIGGQSRSRVAALDAMTGIATPWNPDADSTVIAIVASGSTVYLGGSFAIVGGQPRNRIAAMDATSGLATSWNPDADAAVLALAASATAIYAGGLFGTIGGQPRSLIAALDPATGLATPWDPNAQGRCSEHYYRDYYFCSGGCWWEDCPGVAALAVSGTTVYAGGGFTAIGGQARNHIAALDAATGLATSWDPNAGECVHDEGCEVCGNPCGLAPLSVSDGCDPEDIRWWNNTVCPRVNALAGNDAGVSTGGEFSTMGGQLRGSLAMLDPATGLATGADQISGRVYALASSGSTLYVGGWFTPVPTSQWTGLAAFSAGTVAVDEPMLRAGNVQLRCEPNPFTGSTRIRYSLPSREPVWLAIYDLAGRKVATLLNGESQEPGFHDVALNAGKFPAGMYVCKLRTRTESRAAKIFRTR